jgi:hypothetical protein
MLDESPKPGDLYVKRSADTSVVFLIGPERHYAQVTYGAYDEALDHARRAGSRFSVDVWMTLDGVTGWRLMAMASPAKTARPVPRIATSANIDTLLDIVLISAGRPLLVSDRRPNGEVTRV